MFTRFYYVILHFILHLQFDCRRWSGRLIEIFCTRSSTLPNTTNMQIASVSDQSQNTRCSRFARNWNPQNSLIIQIKLKSHLGVYTHIPLHNSPPTRAVITLWSVHHRNTRGDRMPSEPCARNWTIAAVVRKKSQEDLDMPLLVKCHFQIRAAPKIACTILALRDDDSITPSYLFK